MRWRFVAGIGLALALAVGIAAGDKSSASPDENTSAFQGDDPAKEPATSLIQKVVLLPPSDALSSNPAVQKILAYERAEREKARRKPGSFNLRLPGAMSKSPMPAAPVPKRPAVASPKNKEAAPGEDVSAAQLQAIADALFADALTERLQKLKIAVVSESEVREALKTLKLTLLEASRPEGAEKLRAQLSGDAVLTFSPARIRVAEQQTRILALWVTVRVPALRTAQSAFPPLATPVGAPGAKEPLMLLTEFAVSGAATTGHAFLKSAFARTPPSLAQSASDEAAATALHALRVGSASAFPQEGAQVALVPVPSPTQADQLLFSLEGRKSLPGAIRNLPPDVSERFRPDLLPLFPESVRDTAVTYQALRALHLTSTALWEKEVPNRERVQALGKRLGVGYVLMARVTNIEVDAGAAPPRNEQAADAPPASNAGHPANAPRSVRLAPPPIPPWERQGRAEAVGALVRVRDGAIVWLDRATATMSSRQVVTGEAQIQAANRQSAEDATRFALLQLQRQFRTYRREAAR